MSDARLSDARIKEIEARLNAATEGPWQWEDTQTDEVLCGDIDTGSLRTVALTRPFLDKPNQLPVFIMMYAEEIDAANADFIAHSWEDIRDLLAAIKEIEAERDLWRRRFEVLTVR